MQFLRLTDKFTLFWDYPTWKEHRSENQFNLYKNKHDQKYELPDEKIIILKTYHTYQSTSTIIGYTTSR